MASADIGVVVCGGFDRLSVYQDPTFVAVNDSIISDYSNMGCCKSLANHLFRAGLIFFC